MSGSEFTTASKIENSSFQGAFQGKTHVGGLAGKANVTTKISDVSIQGTVNGTSEVGGFIGEGTPTIEYSYFSNGTITGSSINVAGLIGKGSTSTTSIISHSFFTGAVAISGNTHVGGLVGWGKGNIFHSYIPETVTIKVVNNYLGGLIGRAKGTIKNSCLSGNLLGSRYSAYIGGLVGNAEDIVIENSFTTGVVRGFERVGGIIGYGERVFIKKSYTIAELQDTATGKANFGIIRGDGYSESYQNNYFDNAKASGVNLTGGTGIAFGIYTTKKQDFNGFDFSSHWNPFMSKSTWPSLSGLPVPKAIKGLPIGSAIIYKITDDSHVSMKSFKILNNASKKLFEISWKLIDDSSFDFQKITFGSNLNTLKTYPLQKNIRKWIPIEDVSGGTTYYLKLSGEIFFF